MSAYAGRVRALFEAGLAPAASDSDLIALIEMLIRAGFTSDARALADSADIAARAGADPSWRRSDAYFSFYETVRETTLRANREMAAGGDAGWYEGAILAAVQQLMSNADLNGDPRVAMADTYGVFGSIGETSGYPSLHAGHFAQDERIAVEQHGRSGQLRFIVIDNMIANGFQSWLWDGSAQAGGWSAGDDTIVQVRSAYTASPLRALRRARPGAVRDRYLAEIARSEGEERAALGRDGVASLPAASDRLQLQAIDQIAARVGDDDAAFAAEYWRAMIQYSIELHEGRHALDKASGSFSNEQLEFRAKLSEVGLADYPRLALASVAGQALDNTPHGRANRRFLEGYRRWMRRHAREIEGFDRAQPTLAQIHLLTDAQIRAAAQSMDPWAR
jgi:hypothetical protein